MPQGHSGFRRGTELELEFNLRTIMAYQYVNKQEALLAKVKGKTGKISDKTHAEHLKLYTGYGNKTNAILKELETVAAMPAPANPAHANQIYSEIRSRKVDFTFALGGIVNH